MSDQDIPEVDYQTVRRRVVRRFVKRLLFAANAFFWLTALLSNAFAHDAGSGFVWFLLLIVHFIYAFEIWSRVVDRMTQREIEDLQRKGYRVTPPLYAAPKKAPQGTKQKRDQVARLSDDGEIVFEEPPEPRRASSRK